MSSAGFNFIILKINDIDCTNLSHDETFQVFLKSEEPILIKARRRRAEDGLDKLYLFDEDWISSLQDYHKRLLASSNNDTVVSAGVQTGLPTSCLEHQTPSKPIDSTDYCQRSFDARSIFAHCFAPDIDIEEVTLRKSRSDEKLGLTVSYSSINGSTSVSASDDDDLDSDEITTEPDNENDDGEDDNPCADIYICDILPDSIAARDGRLRQGDQIIQINGKDVASKDETESLFAENKNSITLLVSRCACTEDEFLDSAVYCDEKDQNTGMSLSLDCEASTYSSKSSLPSLSEAQKHQIPLQPITSLDTTVCDHANIRAQLESVNKEISLLNSQISNLKIQNDVQPPQSPHLSTLLSSSQTSVPKNPSAIQQSNLRTPLVNQPPKFMNMASPPPSCQKTIKNVESFPEMSSVNRQAILTTDEILSTATTPSKRNIIGSVFAQKAIQVVQKPSKGALHNIEVEHIYETIPEDSDTDSYYCSPYDGRKGQIRIEQWLKSQDVCDSIHIRDPSGKPPSPPPMNVKQTNLTTIMAKRDVHLNQTTVSRSVRKNTNIDDYENSSSAYNTGDSCTSNPLTLELKNDDTNQSSSSTLVFRPYTSQLESYDNCKQCQVRYRKAKAITKSSKRLLNKDEAHIECSQSNRSNLTLQRSQNAKIASTTTSGSTARSTKLSNKLFRKVVTQNQQSIDENSGNSHMALNTICPNQSIRNISGTGSSGQQQVMQSVVPLPTSVNTSTQSNVENTPMVWKVKRRTDGSRYIVRRPIRHNSTLTSSARNQQVQQYAQHHEIRQNEDQIICTTSGGVLIKDEIITITESSKSSSYRQTASYKQTDNRHMRLNNDRRHSAQYQQQRQDTLVNATCNRNSNNSRLIQKQWVI